MIYIFHGNHTAQSYSEFSELLNNYKLHEKFHQNNKNLDIDSLNRFLNTPSLFSQTKVVILENLFSLLKPQFDIVSKLINSHPDLDYLFWQDKKIETTKLKIFPKSIVKFFVLPEVLFSTLDSIRPQNKIDFVTKINYNAYFYCTKIVSKVMKLQTKYAHKDYYADIIQINSKSGLRGSKANFAYAGGKFGGIGLTQSFALELAPHRIKVNSICPGNYYEGPLWSDPENGLFTQYLKAGKVPGAKTVEEVKAFYLAQVPMNKGCTPEDVVKAVLYLMDQCGETGQALPITGGQVMMS